MFRIYLAGAEAEKKLNESGSELDSAEICRLKLLVRNSQRAKESLITGNWGLILSQVRKYSGMGVPDEDLRHEGVLGLMRAMQNYGQGKSAFSTYATGCQTSIGGTTSASEGLIHPPGRVGSDDILCPFQK